MAEGSAAAPTAQREGALTEGLLRAFALLLLTWFVLNVAHAWWADTSRHTLLLLMISESFTLGLVLFARRAMVRDMSPLAIAATVYASVFFALFGYGDTVHFAPEWACVALQLTGMGWQLASKATLGRCFGLLPASRGLVTAGPYRLVRHPIYLGYLISHVGFLLGNFSWQNLMVLVVLYAAQAVRMHREEAMLSTSEQQQAYSAYRAKVRYRLVPLVY